MTHPLSPTAAARHAFPADQIDPEHCPQVQASVVLRSARQNFNTPTELAWITEPTCMKCWGQLLPDDPN